MADKIVGARHQSCCQGHRAFLCPSLCLHRLYKACAGWCWVIFKAADAMNALLYQPFQLSSLPCNVSKGAKCTPCFFAIILQLLTIPKQR